MVKDFSPVTVVDESEFSGLFRCHMCGFNWIHNECKTVSFPAAFYVDNFVSFGKYDGPDVCPKCGERNFDLTSVCAPIYMGDEAKAFIHVLQNLARNQS